MLLSTGRLAESGGKRKDSSLQSASKCCEAHTADVGSVEWCAKCSVSDSGSNKPRAAAQPGFRNDGTQSRRAACATHSTVQYCNPCWRANEHSPAHVIPAHTLVERPMPHHRRQALGLVKVMLLHAPPHLIQLLPHNRDHLTPIRALCVLSTPHHTTHRPGANAPGHCAASTAHQAYQKTKCGTAASSAAMAFHKRPNRGEHSVKSSQVTQVRVALQPG